MNFTKMVVLVSLSVIYLIFGLLGSGVQILTGVAGGAALVMGVLGAMCMTLSNLIMRKFGAATFMVLIYSILALPLPVIGTPGFFPKIIIATGGGFIADIVFWILRKKITIAALFTGAFGQLTITILFFSLGVLFKMPGINAVLRLVILSCVVVFILAIFGGWLGLYVYKKIENTALIKRIQH